MRRFSSLIISGLMLAAMSAGVYAGEIKEPKTGKTFADSQEVWGKTWVATGTGLRIKSVLGIKAQVYAMAFYVEKSAGAAASTAADGTAVPAGSLSAWKGVAPATAQEDAALFKAMLNCDCARGVELVMLRDVEGPKIRDAFLESTGIELKAQFGIGADDASVKDDLAKLGEFLNYNVKEGNKMKFFVSKKGSLSATGVGGTLTIKNAKVSKALLASWLGTSSRFTEDATLVALKKGLVSNIEALYK
jgi:hypothetical protein